MSTTRPSGMLQLGQSAVGQWYQGDARFGHAAGPNSRSTMGRKSTVGARSTQERLTPYAATHRLPKITEIPATDAPPRETLIYQGSSRWSAGLRPAKILA